MVNPLGAFFTGILGSASALDARSAPSDRFPIDSYCWEGRDRAGVIIPSRTGVSTRMLTRILQIAAFE